MTNKHSWTHPNAKAGDVWFYPVLWASENNRHRVQAERGRFVVPENRASDDSQLIELGFLRFRSLSQKAHPPIIYLSGGPQTENGLDAARDPSTLEYFLKLTEVADVLVLDQRGAGSSAPRLDGIERWNLPLGEPGTREQVLEAAREFSTKLYDFWTSQGVDLRGYTTVENANDVNALREALGYDAMIPMGGSYGSHLSFAVIKQHEAHVHKALISLVEGPDHTVKLPSNVQRTLEKVAGLSNADPTIRSHVPDLIGMLKEVLDRLKKTPVSVKTKDDSSGEDVTIMLGEFDVKWHVADRMGSTTFLKRLPKFIYSLHQKDYSELAKVILRRRRDWFDDAMYFHMDCASGASKERQAQIEHERYETVLEDLIDFPTTELSKEWGSPDAGDTFRAPVVSGVPTLFISGTLDGRTPPSNAEEVAKGFKNYHHLVVEGMSHGDEAWDLQEPDAIKAFLRGETLPHSASIPFSFVPITQE